LGGGDYILDNRFRNIEGAIDVVRRVGCKNQEQWQKVRMCMIKHEEEREMKVRNNGSEVKSNIDK
jgi:hypothetical protein